MRIFGIVILVVCMVALVPAQIPRIMNYQGKLTDANGVAVVDTSGTGCSGRAIGFQIYNVSTGGTPLWGETLCVRIVKGLFDVQLGNIHPINLDFSAPYWMEVVVDNDDDGSISTTADTLLPREKLVPVAFAFRSIYADSVSGVASDDDWQYSSGSGISGDIYHMGNVGIGVSNPVNKLGVNGSVWLNGTVDFNKNEAVNFRLENRTSDPSAPVVGQMWIRTDL